MHFQGAFLGEEQWALIRKRKEKRVNKRELTWRDDENETMRPKKSSGLGASGESGFSP